MVHGFLIALLGGVLPSVSAQWASPAEEVPLGHRAYAAVSALERNGGVTGYPRGYFCGYQTRTRGEFALAARHAARGLRRQFPLDSYSYSYDWRRWDAYLNRLPPLVDEFGPELTGLGEDVPSLKLEIGLTRFDPLKVSTAIRSGADLRGRSLNGITTLMLAAATGDLDLAQRALRSGVAANARDHSGATAMHYAAAFGRPGVVELLARAGGEVDARHRTGHTPLTWAALGGQPSALPALLARGADPNARGQYGYSALESVKFLAGEGRRVQLVRRLLIQAGARE
ncbi:MAG TPA: ankyrin repeat domain-containing protein [Armatimonadota bacterium]|nr:ankyrin repeat domain-containing protein [Armatimonadota bacterium]